MIVRKPFPLPRIQDCLQSIGKFRYATSLDLSMGYWGMKLSVRAKELCTIVLPWGLYQYKYLSMGVILATDIFRARLMKLLRDIVQVLIYIDDILCNGDDDFSDHMKVVAEVINRLRKNGIRLNIKKCFFARDAVEYMGFLISREGIKPIPAKVQKIIAIKAPSNTKQLRRCAGFVNYYKDMYKKRAEILSPLTTMCGKNVPLKWTKEAQNSFKKIKAIVAKQIMLAFPDYNKPFTVYTDASDYQLGGVVTQEGKLIAFFSPGS